MSNQIDKRRMQIQLSLIDAFSSRVGQLDHLNLLREFDYFICKIGSIAGKPNPQFPKEP